MRLYGRIRAGRGLDRRFGRCIMSAESLDGGGSKIPG